MDAQLVELEDLAEEQVNQGSESSKEMLGEDHDLALRWRGHHLSPGGTSFDIGGKKAGKPIPFKLLRRNGGSAPICRDGSLG